MGQPTEEKRFGYLTTPDLQLRLVALPAYSPDFNALGLGHTANECLKSPSP